MFTDIEKNIIDGFIKSVSIEFAVQFISSNRDTQKIMMGQFVQQQIDGLNQALSNLQAEKDAREIQLNDKLDELEALKTKLENLP